MRSGVEPTVCRCTYIMLVVYFTISIKSEWFYERQVQTVVFTTK